MDYHRFQQSNKIEIYIKQLIRSYELYQAEARKNIQLILERFKQEDLSYGKAWEDIMKYWHYANTMINVNVVARDEYGNITQDQLPDDLGDIPMDDHVVIVILGIKLDDDGTMSDELIGRLQVGLAIAKRLKNAYVVVTGGATAKKAPEVTEGGLMGAWLLSHGLEKHRLIIENKAPDTVSNAKYTYHILKEKYPQVDSVVMVSSDYHVSRACMLYYSTLILAALEVDGKPLKMVGNAGFKTGIVGYESINLQALCMCQVANIDYLKLLVELE